MFINRKHIVKKESNKEYDSFCKVCNKKVEEITGWCDCNIPIEVDVTCVCCGVIFPDWIEKDCVGEDMRGYCLDCACPATPCKHN